MADATGAYREPYPGIGAGRPVLTEAGRRASSGAHFCGVGKHASVMQVTQVL